VPADKAAGVAAINRKPPRHPWRRPGRLLLALLRRLQLAPVARTTSVERRGTSPDLRAFMLAAAALPGLLPSAASALDAEEVKVQFGHYEETPRQFWPGPDGTLRPPSNLRVDTLRASTGLKLSDRVRLGIEFMQDTWSGATPYITAPEGFITMTGASAFVAADKAAAAARVDRVTLAPLNLSGTPLVRRDRLVNLMTSASPETRNQLRLQLDREWDEFALGGNVRLSDEPDYRSISLGLSGRWDFDQKRSTVVASAARTSSRVDAGLGPPSAFVDYGLYASGSGNARIDTVYGPGIVANVPSSRAPTLRFRGDREDTSLGLNLTRVVTKNATLGAGLGFSRSNGFLESPHKLALMGFANPTTPPVFNYLFTTLFAVPEKRPDKRDQVTLNLRWSQFVPAVDGALHVDYAHARDDWGIRSDTYEAKWMQPVGEGWMITPRLRYYTQTAANFYRPYFLFRQAYPRLPSNPGLLDFGAMPIEYWSSDQRLSGFGARSIGIVISKQIARDVRLEIGYEDYMRAGRLKRGGGGEDAFADVRARMLNVGLSFDLASRSTARSATDAHHHHGAHHVVHEAHVGADAPAGVMNAHMLDRPGDFMLGYSATYAEHRGHILHGGQAATDAAILASCGAPGCPTTPRRMTMHMHMLHLMLATSENVNLTLMPQLMSMRMDHRMLDGGFYTAVGAHAHGDMDLSGHSSGGFGDTVFGASVRLWRSQHAAAHITLAMSAPTGSIAERMGSHGGELQDYSMQLGSGTWDFQPSLTWLGTSHGWSWGAQAGGTLRLDGPNRQGYKLGNAAFATAWIGRALTQRLAGTLRVQHAVQGTVRGSMRGATAAIDGFGNTIYPRPQHSSADIVSNHGGRYTDVGLGVSYGLDRKQGHGDRIALEWLAPVRSRGNGFQLERAGSVTLNWHMMF
jgi:hypothetical protein